MKPSFICLRLFSLLWLLPVAVADAQTPAHHSDSPGWTSAWMQPANERAREDQTLTKRFDQLLDAGKYPEALVVSSEGIKAFPDDSRYYARRAQILLKMGQLERALQDIDHGMRLALLHKDTFDQSVLLNFRANLEARHGSYALAVKDLEDARRLNPRDAMHANSLAWIRATCPQPEIRNGPEGVKLAKAALALHPQNPYATLDTLAAAYAESNDYARAMKTEKEAMASAQKTPAKDAYSPTFLQGAATRLQLYERGQPYHHDTWAQ